MDNLNQAMRDAERKAAQASLLLERVHGRLARVAPAMLPEAPQFVAMFLLCLEEMEKIRETHDVRI